jgi:hypothetical protein
LNNTPFAARHAPRLFLDLEAITAHFDALLNTDRCPLCAPVVLPVAADAVHLLTEIIRLYDALTAARLESANLRAAIQAALGAADDGEADPLMFLRWDE